MDIKQADFYPLKDNIVVKVAILKLKSDGGVIIPDSVLEQRAKERGINRFIEVVAVGPDCKRVQVGMRVLAVKPPMALPHVVSDDPGFELGFMGEYSIEGYI